MPRFVAFLRAINVGGHTVRMEDLRRLFESLRFSGVETFIASGNVVFQTRSEDVKALEAKIARHLRKALGYEVTTFVRSVEELSAIVAWQPFSAADFREEEHALYVAFLGAPPAAEAFEALVGLRTAHDEFDLRGREIYWLRRRGFNESPLAGKLFEKTIGMPVTVRNATTVRKLAAKCSPAAPSQAQGV
jgi:uncharacterized protein (DUF1697 family)